MGAWSDRRNGVNWFLLAYGGQYGRRETLEFFENRGSSLQNLEMKCFLLFYFWCIEGFVEEAESLVDRIGAL